MRSKKEILVKYVETVSNTSGETTQAIMVSALLEALLDIRDIQADILDQKDQELDLLYGR